MPRLIALARASQTIALNVFEPRYRLMMRRCLAGDRHFGIIGCDSAPRDKEMPLVRNMQTLGSEVEITDSRQLHDGRYHLKVRVVRRFHVIQKWDLDGYRVARVDFVVDQDDDTEIEPPAEPVPGGAAEPTSCTMSTAVAMAIASKQRANVTVERLAAQVQAMVKEWLLRAKELSSHSPKMLLLFRQLVARAGKPPARSQQNGELYSFWVGNILPTSSRDRQLMLSCRSTRVR